jgi:hypothetical protein
MIQLVPFRGEPEDAASIDEARRWVLTYRALVTFEEDILAMARRRSQRMPELVRLAVEQTNLEPLADLINQMARRLAYWESRLAQLS